MKTRTIAWLSVLTLFLSVVLSSVTSDALAARAGGKQDDGLLVSFLVDGEYGGGGWFRSATRAYSVLDGLKAKDAVVYLSVDGGSAKKATEYLVQSGSAELTWTVFVNGNQTDTFIQRVKVDVHPPATHWELRPIDSRSRPLRPIDIPPVPLSGSVQLSGISYDSMSGIKHAEISIDAGRTWIIIPLPKVEMKHRAELKWTVVVDTTLLPNGSHTFLARTVDGAGNIGENMTLDVMVSN